MKVALVQMRCEKGQIARNLTRTAEIVEEAADVGADLVCFTEMSVTGYVDPRAYPDAVLEWDDPRLSPLFEASRRTGITVCAGIAERNLSSKPFTSHGVIRDGELLGAYRKINLPPDQVDGFSLGTAPLVHRHGEVDIGLAICADIDSEALFRNYAESGVKVVLSSSAPGLDGSRRARDWRAGYAWWRAECRAKLGACARKYGLHIAVATQAGRTVDEDFPGGGYLFDDRGDLVAQTTDGSEGMLVVDIRT